MGMDTRVALVADISHIPPVWLASTGLPIRRAALKLAVPDFVVEQEALRVFGETDRTGRCAIHAMATDEDRERWCMAVTRLTGADRGRSRVSFDIENGEPRLETEWLNG